MFFGATEVEQSDNNCINSAKANLKAVSYPEPPRRGRGKGQIAPEPQDLRDLITPNASLGAL